MQQPDAFSSAVLRLAVTGGARRLFWPTQFDALLECGLIDADGNATTAGRAAWAAYSLSTWEDALMRNLIPRVPADAMRGLGRLIDGHEPTPAEEVALRPFQSLAYRHPIRGDWNVTAVGRKAYVLAAGRTY
jgi:hypothetical protein